MKKTRIIVELTTKNMEKVVPEEYVGRIEECPKEELGTEDTEQSLHDNFVRYFENRIQEDGGWREEFEEELMEDEAGVEGFECLDDYGSVKITIKIEKLKNRKDKK